jgi:hypothetical protein
MKVINELSLPNEVVPSKSRLIVESVGRGYGRQVKVIIYLESVDYTGVEVDGYELINAVKNALNK